MTSQRIRRLQTKIRESRARLIEEEPYYALLLMYLRFIAVKDIKTISTNGRCIFFSPDYLDRLYTREMDYILCHQISHIVLGDLWRTEDLAGYNYHLACDIRLNLELQDSFPDDRFAHFGNVHRSMPGLQRSLAGLGPEEIYPLRTFSLNRLDDRARRSWLPDCDDYWDRKNDDGEGGTLILDIADQDGLLHHGGITGGSDQQQEGDGSASGNPDKNGNGASSEKQGTDSADQELKQEWQGRMQVVGKAISNGSKSYGADSLPAYLQRLIRNPPKPKADWKKILNRFLREQICDYSFSPPDRRFADTGFFLPDFNEKEFVSRDILFMVDTSGSVDDEMLTLVYGEIRGAVEQFGGKLSGMLGFFDADVKPPTPFETVGDLLQIIPVGGGGTDFRPIFEYVQRNYRGEKPAYIVIFTDGEGPYPEERAAIGIPVLWLINNMTVTPQWGKTIRVLPVSE